MWTMTWAVKASKLCNLRCRYCYEWDDLANPARISPAHWGRILSAARRFHELQTELFGEAGRTTIVWHGGEPLLLPLGYFEEVLRLERDILGRSALERHEFVNFVQTNLYALDERKLELLQRERFEFGVSLDHVPGVRTTSSGRETAERVRANLFELLRRGIPVWGAVVLGRHTCRRLREIYDFYESVGVPFRLIPLSQPPGDTPDASFSVTDAEVVGALEDLFEHWMSRGASLPVEPLRMYLDTVLLAMTGLGRLPYDRREHGERLIVVDTNGSLYTPGDRYLPGRALGNLFESEWDAILGSSAYAESLRRDARARDERCRSCEFLGACDTYPAFSSPDPPPGERCRIAFEMQTFIEEYLRGTGVTEADLVAAAARESGWGARTVAPSGPVTVTVGT